MKRRSTNKHADVLIDRRTDGQIDRRTDDDQKIIRKAHLKLQLRWAIMNFFVVYSASAFQCYMCTKGIAENLLRCSPSSLWSYFNQRFEFSQTASTFRLSFFLKTLLKNRFEGLLSSYMNTIGFRRNNIKKIY